MKVRVVIQARMLSRRMRGKSLIAVHGKPLLARVLERARAMSFVDEVVVATSREAADDPIVAVTESLGGRCIRGDQDDVLARYVMAAEDMVDDDVVVRMTADNPLYDPRRSELAFHAHTAGDWDYTHVDSLSHMVPEIIRVEALRRCAEHAVTQFDREHVTPFLRKNVQQFKVQKLAPDFAGLRPDLDRFLTIDSHEDLERFEQIFSEVERPGELAHLDDCYLWLDKKNGRFRGAVARRPGDVRVTLAGYEVGDGCPTFITAEIGQNHNGDMNTAMRLIDMAARCGADAVKFQKRDIRFELTAEAYNRPYDNPNSFGRTYGEHREFLELDEGQHRELREYAMAQGILYFCTACDEPSVEVMERIGSPFYKVASRDIANVPLLRALAHTRKPVILSSGMAGMEEIAEAIETLGDGPSAIIVLQCISQYPADVERTNLRAMHTIRDRFSVLVGLSDHTAGVIPSVAASALGACFVEKHVTLSRAMKGTDHAASLEEEGLRRLVTYIRQTEAAMGDGVKAYDSAADAAKQKLARSLTSRVHIRAGTVLTEDMLILKSPGTGLPWRDRERVVGRIAARDIPADEMIVENDFRAVD